MMSIHLTLRYHGTILMSRCHGCDASLGHDIFHKRGSAMAEKKKMVQTTLRIDPETLLDARHYLNLQGLSVTKFLTEKLEEVARAYRTMQPAGPSKTPGRRMHDD